MGARTASRHALGWRESNPAPARRRGWPLPLIVGALAITAAWLYLLAWAFDLLLQGLR
jgi:hypothetical protein